MINHSAEKARNSAVAQDCHDITAAILAGGLGTRLRSALPGVPKVLAPVGQRPFITLLLDQLASAGVRTVVLLTGYGASQVHRALGTRYAEMNLIYSVEHSPLGTAGAVRQALPALDTDTLLLLNGDSYCEVNLPDLVSVHRQRRADLTLTLAHVGDASRFGQVRMTADGRLTHFGEKQEDAGPGWINAGVYLLEKVLAREIAPGPVLSLEKDVLPQWVATRRCFGFPQQKRFLDIGTPSAYFGAETFFQDI